MVRTGQIHVCLTSPIWSAFFVSGKGVAEPQAQAILSPRRGRGTREVPLPFYLQILVDFDALYINSTRMHVHLCAGGAMERGRAANA